MSDTSRLNVGSGVAGRVAGLSAALMLVLAACGEPATEGEQQQGSVAPPTEQSQTMATEQEQPGAAQTNTQ